MQALQDLSMYELAEVVLDKVVKLEPDNPQAYLSLGLEKYYRSSYIFGGLKVHVKLSAEILNFAVQALFY